MRLPRTIKLPLSLILVTAFLVSIFASLFVSLWIPVVASADEPDQKVVRIGWFDSSFCYIDRFGRRCGIDYEYHQKISAYTGWTYEYVEDSWPNLLQMLKDGEIDMLSDVSYRPDREEYMYFSDCPWVRKLIISSLARITGRSRRTI